MRDTQARQRVRTWRARSNWLPVVQAILGDVPVMRGYGRLWVAITACPQPFCDCQHCWCRCKRSGRDSCRCHAAECYCEEAEPLRLLEARPLGWAVRDSPAGRGVRQLVLIDTPGTSPAVRRAQVSRLRAIVVAPRRVRRLGAWLDPHRSRDRRRAYRRLAPSRRRAAAGKLAGDGAMDIVHTDARVGPQPARRSEAVEHSKKQRHWLAPDCALC